MSQTRIDPLFERLRAEKRPALIAYITAGDPTPERTRRASRRARTRWRRSHRAGSAVLRSHRGRPCHPARLRTRTCAPEPHVTTVLRIAAEIRRYPQIPLLLFTYMNPLLRYGFEKLARDAVAAGIDGVLLTDLSVEEARRSAPPRCAEQARYCFSGRAHQHGTAAATGRAIFERISSI